MKKNLLFVVSLVIIMAMVLTACANPAATEAPVVEEPEAPAAEETAPEEPAAEEPVALNPGLQMEQAQVAMQFWSEDEFAKQMELMSAAPLNPDDPIYLQYLEESPTDISQYPQYADFAAKEAPYNICFSNAGVNNPWRVVGYINMREQVEQYRSEGLVKNFIHLDAQGNDAKQIADIQDIINTPGKCDILIVSPNTSEALTQS